MRVTTDNGLIRIGAAFVTVLISVDVLLKFCFIVIIDCFIVTCIGIVLSISSYFTLYAVLNRAFRTRVCTLGTVEKQSDIASGGKKTQL